MQKKLQRYVMIGDVMKEEIELPLYIWIIFGIIATIFLSIGSWFLVFLTSNFR